MLSVELIKSDDFKTEEPEQESLLFVSKFTNQLKPVLKTIEGQQKQCKKIVSLYLKCDMAFTMKMKKSCAKVIT
jgi:hypothetical protein